MFPGQGTQRPGMGRRFERMSAAASAVFDLGGRIVGRDLRALCFSARPRDLTPTENAQVAIFTCNAAAAAVLAERGWEPTLAIGHSVGELNALCAAGALSLTDGFRLVAARGEAMGSVPEHGAMASVVGLDAQDVERLCAQVDAAGDGPVRVALLNAPGHVVVSGTVAGVGHCERLAAGAGARKVSRLTVSGAFHSPLMAPGIERWSDAVASADIATPAVPVVLNVTGRPAADTGDIRRALVAALVRPVRWVEVVRTAAALGVTHLVEAGDSHVLSTLVRAISPAITCTSLDDPRALRMLGPVTP